MLSFFCSCSYLPEDKSIHDYKNIQTETADFPSVTHWVIGGHSLGGVVATASVKEDPEAFDGLILLAS
jgi:alpha-beta hydrolase superfamily lysophospholipase